MTREYVFVDEWEVGAPARVAFDAIADSRTYLDWWRPVYLEVSTDGPPRVGGRATHRFKGRLPYTLRTEAVVTCLDRPHRLEVEVDGDLRGTGTWTFTPLPRGRTQLRFDWVVHADKPILRALSPLLRPLFRWNHRWAIRRAQAGLEPYLHRVQADERRSRGTAGAPP